MNDESTNISAKTWARAANSVQKVGYMDGAADGQAAVFQSSFDTGYEQGFSFGLQLGINQATASLQQRGDNLQESLRDPRRINCQICLNTTTTKENIGNLYNKQKETNDEYLARLQNNKV